MVRTARTLAVRTSAGGLGLGAALVLAACAAGPQAPTTVASAPSSASSAAPAESSMPTANAVAPPSTAPATPQPTEPFAIKEGPLSPGRYLQGGFPTGLSFVLGTGWKAYFDDAEGAYLGGPNGVELGINRPPKVVDPKTGQGLDSPADLAAWLAESPAFDGATSSSVKVGGKQATLVEATSDGDHGLFFYASGNFHTVAGGRYRFYVFPMDGPDLVFMETGIGAAFEQNLPILKTIVDSIRFEGS